MKVRLTLVNDSDCELDTIETEAKVRDEQFSASDVSYIVARWQLRNGDTIRVSIPGMEE